MIALTPWDLARACWGRPQNVSGLFYHLPHMLLGWPCHKWRVGLRRPRHSWEPCHWQTGVIGRLVSLAARPWHVMACAENQDTWSGYSPVAHWLWPAQRPTGKTINVPKKPAQSKVSLLETKLLPVLGPHSALNAIQEALVVGKDEELLVILQHVCHIVLHGLDLHIMGMPHLCFQRATEGRSIQQQ